MAVTRRNVKGLELTWTEIDGNLDYIDVLSIPIRTIATGIITVNGPAVYRIETEGAAAMDDLTSILGGLGHEEPIILTLNTPGQVITIKHTPPNLLLQNGADMILSTVNDTIEFRSRTTSIWREVHRCLI